jgi:hypothetical protein
MSGFNLPGGPLPASPWHSIIPPQPGPVNVGYNGAPAMPTGWGDFTGAQVARPTAEQLAGGHTMVAPRAEAGGGGGATPSLGYGAPQSAGGTGVFGGGGSYVYQNPEDYARSFMSGHGFSPYAHTPVTDSMYQLLAKALPAIFDLAGQGGLALDQLADPSGMLNSIFFSGPGSAFGKMADYGRQGFENLRDQIGAMDPDTQAQLISASSGLRSAGMNPFQQNAVKRTLEQQLGGYRDMLMQNRTNPAAASTKLWDYLVNAGLDPFAYTR